MFPCKGTDLGKNNSEPKSMFEAFHVNGLHVKQIPSREEAGGAPGDVPSRRRVTGPGQRCSFHNLLKKPEQAAPGTRREECHYNDMHVETMFLSFCTFS